MKLHASLSILALSAATAATAAIAQTSTPSTTHPHHAAAASTLPKGIPPVHGVMHTAYALKYIDVKVGTGETAAPMKYYTVNYTGWLASDGKKFDSSYDHGAPFSPPAPLGAHRVIPGWDTGLVGMKVGGKRRLFIPYQLAYGESGTPTRPGHPQDIPPKSDLIFDIELLALSDKPAVPHAPQPAPGAPRQTPPDRPQAAPPAGSAPAAPTAPSAAPAPAAPSSPTAPSTPPPSTTATPPSPPITPHN